MPCCHLVQYHAAVPVRISADRGTCRELVLRGMDVFRGVSHWCVRYLTVDMLSQGGYMKALPLYAWALKIWEAALGPDHLDVASGLNNMALMLEAQVRTVRRFSSPTRKSIFFKFCMATDVGGTLHLVLLILTRRRHVLVYYVYTSQSEMNGREPSDLETHPHSEIFRQPAGGRRACYVDLPCVGRRLPYRRSTKKRFRCTSGLCSSGRVS